MSGRVDRSAFLDPRFKMLTSYWYYRTTDMGELCDSVAGPDPLVFADSGAHTARTKGVSISLAEYADWCVRWDHRLTVYSNLDVIRAPAATWVNQQRLEQDHGLRPLPVFHTGESWDWLDRYLAAGYRYIALGKLLGEPIAKVMAWLAKAFAMADGKAVFHGFGMTVWPALRDFPFYSVDSSSWGSAFRYGSLKLFDDRGPGRWLTARVGDRSSVARHRDLLRAHGVEPARIADRSRYHRSVAAAASAVAWKRAETYIRARHGPVHLPASDKCPVRRPSVEGADPGLHLHLAETGIPHIQSGAAGLHLHLAEGHAGNLRSGGAGLHLHLAVGGVSDHTQAIAGHNATTAAARPTSKEDK